MLRFENFGGFLAELADDADGNLLTLLAWVLLVLVGG